VSPEVGGLPITVTVVEELGADAFVYGSSDVAGVPHTVVVRVGGRDSVRKADVTHVTTDPQNVHVFDTETGERISD
jgi:multiple sugar transport system ATP-binding protein